MIIIKINRDENGFIKEIESSGHSGYAEEGKDIICSAVSAVIQTALLGLMDISNEEVKYKRNDGYLKFKCPKPIDEKEREKQQTILKTMIIGLKDIQSGYKAFIKMEER